MAMALAPDGRVLSPGEVYEEQVVEPQKEEWTEDLNVLFMCPDCKEVPPNLIEEFSSGDTVCGSCGRVLADSMWDRGTHIMQGRMLIVPSRDHRYPQ